MGSTEMTRLHEEEKWYEAARLLPSGPARQAFLDQVCAGDPALRARLESLLGSGEVADRFFQTGAKVNSQVVQQLTDDDPEAKAVLLSKPGVDEEIGRRIGAYKLLQRLGEGGCGIVYMAEQEMPIRRFVALKIIKLGMDTKSVIARFEAERQALALMDHINIAKVLDAGATDTGRPFFVMELVRGIKITDYCNQNSLDTRQRLDLFIQICQAIQHAHQKGIIHRDIKPSNILVTLYDGVGVPKVIDFGIAKATELRLTDHTLFTAYEQMIGTPAYMSPEQAEMSGLDVDTRSDIYSLGVLLYELLTGKTPFDPQKLVQGGLDEMRRTLREKDPPRPSAMVTTLQGEEQRTVTRQRQVELPKLVSLLSGDLDWIVMKALEKDRRRRYEMVNGLALDVRHYLNNEPITARPPSRLYRFQKLVRRNKVVFAAGTAVMIALFAGLGTSTFLFLKERQAKERAVAAEQREFDLRRQAELRETITKMTLLVSREKYQEANELLNSVSFIQPSLEGAAVLRSLGEWHACAGRWAPAADCFCQLLTVDQLDGWDVETLDCLECGAVLAEMGDYTRYNQFRLEAVKRLGDPSSPATDRIVKISLLMPADASLFQALKPLADVTLQQFKSAITNSQDGDFRASWQCISLALMDYRQGNYQEASTWCHRCLAYPEFNAPRAATAHVILAMASWKMHDFSVADSEYRLGRSAIEAKFTAGMDRGGAINGFWFDWLFARVLMQEAQGLFDPAQ